MSTLARPTVATKPPVLIGESPLMRTLDLDINAAARSDAKVLITGETGTGKEVVARLVHDRSPRQRGPFITINCAGVPDSLLESEFFGHVRGSFTGAYRDNPGLLRQGDGGTVFLDEVGEMSLRMQALLLRFLETGEIQPVGGMANNSRADVRIITATNRDLVEAVSSREFREDLFYRLNVLHLKVPPLNERGADIELLVHYYVEIFSAQHQVPAPRISREAFTALRSHSWSGNVRELRNVVERVVLRANTDVVEPIHLPAEITNSTRTREAEVPAGLLVSHRARVDGILDRMLTQKESFWTTVYPAFMVRDLTRDDLRFIVRAGLEQTRGSYRVLLDLFRMPPQDYKRFLGFLKQHDCHLPFQRFRMLNAPLDASRSHSRPLA
jgi:transcriptional regulator with PAS, ATPase and Fis domain